MWSGQVPYLRDCLPFCKNGTSRTCHVWRADKTSGTLPWLFLNAMCTVFVVVSLEICVPWRRLLEKWDLAWGWSAQRTSLLRCFYLSDRPKEALLRTVGERHGVYICLWWLIAVVPWNYWLVHGLTFRPLCTNFRNKLRVAAVNSTTVTAGKVLGLLLFLFNVFIPVPCQVLISSKSVL